jgi:hypothetical protein
MEITQLNEIKSLQPCRESIEYLNTQADLKSAWGNCHNGTWMIWYLRRKKLLSKNQSVQIAINCAESVIDIYKKKYPHNKAPYNAIQAAKNWIENPTEKNRKTAAAAAATADAYDAAANAAAAAAAAANAADAAATAAADAAAAAADAAYADAYDAVAYADAADAVAYAAADADAAAADAAYADAYDAAAYDAAAAAAAAAAAEKLKQANFIKTIITNPFI